MELAPTIYQGVMERRGRPPCRANTAILVLLEYWQVLFEYLVLRVPGTKFWIDLKLARPKFRIKFSMILDLLLVSDHSL
eukprot:SAG31_NODE_38243_length_297_cov_4.631313_1_plen_78_part_01